MANEEQLSILRQGVKVWNDWRERNTDIRPDLREADLSWQYYGEGDPPKAILNGVTLSEDDLPEGHTSDTNQATEPLDEMVANSTAQISELNGDIIIGGGLVTQVTGYLINGIHLEKADLRNADLRGAHLIGAYLTGANLNAADLSHADLRNTDLRGAHLIGADLRNADLRGAALVGTNLTQTNLSGCHIFGISAWGVKLNATIQVDLVITNDDEPIVTVDNLEVAQFVYLLLHNEKIRDVIDTITSKAVLILGRFTPERKAVLDALRDELRKRNYTPILFDFDKPSNRDLTETVMTLAGMARFVIADLSDPNSIPHELMSFTEKLLSVPVQALFCPVPEHKNEYPMFEHLARYPQVLPIYRYESQEQLISVLSEKVIEPAEAKVAQMKPKKLW